MKTLIKNGQIVTAVDDYKADILISSKTYFLEYDNGDRLIYG